MRERALVASAVVLAFLKGCCFGDCGPRLAGEAGLRAGDADGSGDRGRRARSTSTRSRRAGVNRAGGGWGARPDGRITTMGGGVRASSGGGGVWWRRPL